MFPKFIRKQDRAFLSKIKCLPCCICGREPPHYQIDPSHIKTVGSGGHDDEWNVVPMCRQHHTEWHMLGPNKFTQMYPTMNKLLKRLGWSWNMGKLHHEKAEK